MDREIIVESGELPGTETFNTIVSWEELLSYLKGSDEDKAQTKKAYDFAELAHRQQKRISGAPYFCHVSRVGLSLARLGLDYGSVAAALLHDTVEDTRISMEDIEKEFGAEIAGLVDGVTKISTRVSSTKEDHQAENLRKMMVAMAKDIRVLLIKLADRLHNIRTIAFLPDDKARRICRETLDVYAPLANRLGIARWKWELEDRCMAVLYPAEFKELDRKINEGQGNRDQRLIATAEKLQEELANAGIEAQISGRTKHYWSIYQKILKEHKKFEEIYDLVALRVITENLKECYGAFGIVHSIWTPIPGRVKDYIAIPKSNMYQSLHTTVMGPDGYPLEIQVRTAEMHRTAQEGIAAHWAYKEGDSSKSAVPELPFLKNVLEWQTESKDTRDFMEFLKIDLYDDEVFVFTPKGEVKMLPAHSTAIDFAYAVHSKVGDQCYGGMINGKIAPLRQQLKSGDIVRVLTSPGHKPGKDWLSIVATSKAKNRIRHALKIEQKSADISKGKEALLKELKRRKIGVKDLYKSSKISGVLKRFHCSEVDDLLAALGTKEITPRQVSEQIENPEHGKARETLDRKRSNPAASEDRGVEVKGVRDVVVQLAKCCTPVYGDSIIGYITVGRGVSVHRGDCSNTADLSRRVDRLVEVRWVGSQDENQPIALEVAAFDRERLMSDMLVAIAETQHNGQRTSLTAASARTGIDKAVAADFTVMIDNLDHLKRVMLNLYQVDGVSSVKRKEKRTRRRSTESIEAAETSSAIADQKE